MYQPLSLATIYRLVQKKGTVLLSTSLAWPAMAGCSRAETFSQLSAISFAQPCKRYPELLKVAITVAPTARICRDRKMH